MTDKPRTFPLPLSSVTDKGQKKQPVFGPVATPQTATRNAALSAAALGAAAGTAFGDVGKPMREPAREPARGVVHAAPHGGASGATARPLRQAGSVIERVQPAAPRQDALVSGAVRRAMVARVAKMGVRDPVVLNALEAVPRHLFVEEGLAPQAYIDASLPIGHHQTISQPYIVARMIEVMRQGAALKSVLEIGTGCGYQAAVLACIAQDVYSIERIKPLHELAKANLRPLRVPNLRLHYGDGMLGLPQAAPFDGIILAAAGLEVPRALLEQLAIGGRLVAPVGERTQHLELVTRVAKSEWQRQLLEDCHFVPLRPGTV
ncbi:protein-L-isoaspartate(D-aspartate) O-methyltransferase [Massilia dura]|uniref:Protein-L-isoaspartate O-methyltransferase n=1 Tax=Pseudoduganella dura TaxID=321982 RepID=A0A6I3XEY9_9BURK|nr:protein-L-isoaspartate(D-aspartate) O-methyltransferase [Pseudoduganella dura]MUI15009.1 protein-L-isoaspartate(D-aspartate) O-methyltransferase [Pseudoduganella dura]GGY08459.1 protein-L-isoaspartate O-methyltransferase [Pseudoduganella dura]